ncbi:hypothetical protein [Pseudomonas graminis]|uniref:Uncharacterized protein n=1 Tax=Pseudomonas graminis TaxID=158627 RepID=A0A1I0H227_9PSED|nr:hypothetical protein [Pseudomonas graminis]SET76748.1 hypothetical protein SAMN05216197_12471 [Pseudomonas graminis]
MVNVQFLDADKKKVIAYLASPQDDEQWPNQGKVEGDDPRLIEYLSTAPEAVKQAVMESR